MGPDTSRQADRDATAHAEGETPVTGDGDNDPPDGDEPPDTGGGGNEDEDVRQLSTDLLFDLVKNSRRRAVVATLWERDEPAPLGDLAEEIAAVENDTTVEGVSSTQRKRVYVGLYQSHVPKLAEAGVVTHDASTGEVGLGPTAPQLYPYLPEIDANPSRPWHRYYLGFGLAMGALLVGALATGVATGPMATLLSVLALGGLCAIAGVHAILDGL